MLKGGKGVRNYPRRVLKITQGPKKVPYKGKPIESIRWLDMQRITQKQKKSFMHRLKIAQEGLNVKIS